MSKNPLECCPACGHTLESRNVSACSLCGCEFSDQRVTNADVTPYANAYSRNEFAFSRMIRWVFFASSERIKHLGLMRSSAASRRFTWFALSWFSLALALYANSRIGWHFAGESSGGAAGNAAHPGGDGWVRLSSNSTPAPPQASAIRGLWWNPAQSLIAASASFVLGIAMGWLCVGILRLGANFAHFQEFRSEGRMSAAISYATAFFALCMIGGAAISLRPLTFVLRANSSVSPATDAIEILAAILTGVPLVVWWIWLIRLGAGAPTVARNRVTMLMLLVPPACVMGIAAAIYWGLEWFDRCLVPMMHLQF